MSTWPTPQQALALEHYLQAQGLAGKGPLTLTPLTGGQSNPTFRLSSGEQQYVLRKKPPGQLIASAHAIDREHRVMKALENSAVPVPRCGVTAKTRRSLARLFT